MPDINTFIDREIRPTMREHGVDVEVVSYASNVVTIKYRGVYGRGPADRMGDLIFIQLVLREFDSRITVEMA